MVDETKTKPTRTSGSSSVSNGSSDFTSSPKQFTSRPPPPPPRHRHRRTSPSQEDEFDDDPEDASRSNFSPDPPAAEAPLGVSIENSPGNASNDPPSIDNEYNPDEGEVGSDDFVMSLSQDGSQVAERVAVIPGTTTPPQSESEDIASSGSPHLQVPLLHLPSNEDGQDFIPLPHLNLPEPAISPSLFARDPPIAANQDESRFIIPETQSPIAANQNERDVIIPETQPSVMADQAHDEDEDVIPGTPPGGHQPMSPLTVPRHLRCASTLRIANMLSQIPARYNNSVEIIVRELVNIFSNIPNAADTDAANAVMDTSPTRSVHASNNSDRDDNSGPSKKRRLD